MLRFALLATWSEKYENVFILQSILTVLVTSVITTVGIQKPGESGCRMGQILNCINLNGIENHSNSDTQNIQYSNASGIQMFGIGYAEIF